jgi:hypothetical protein
MKNNFIYTLILALAVLTSSCRRENSFGIFRGLYPASGYPGDKPEVFSPGSVCTGFNERDITISPDGTEIFYGLSTGRMVTIMYTRFDGRRWKEPVVAPFAGDRRFSWFEPCFSPDGKSVWFLTTMPVKGNEPKPGWAYQNIFFSARGSDGTWSQPTDPAGCINEGDLQFYPSVTRSGTLYFCRTDKGTGRHGLFKSELVSGIYGDCSRLPEPVNSDTIAPFNVFVSPDETFMIACISGICPDWNPGRSNYFLFIRNNDGSWSGPAPLGPEINIPGSNATSSSLSPDGKYFFFAAQVPVSLPDESEPPESLSEIINMSATPRNGNYDIYWVDAGVIRRYINDLRMASVPEPLTTDK